MEQEVPKQLALLNHFQAQLRDSFAALFLGGRWCCSPSSPWPWPGHRRRWPPEDPRKQQALDDLITPIRDVLQQVDHEAGGGRETASRPAPRSRRCSRPSAAARRSCAPRPPTSCARCARRPSAADGARCSCAASSRWPACSSPATSTSSPRAIAEDGRLRPDLLVRLPGGTHGGRRREGAARGLSRRAGAQDDDDARTASSPITRARCATT